MEVFPLILAICEICCCVPLQALDAQDNAHVIITGIRDKNPAIVRSIYIPPAIGCYLWFTAVSVIIVVLPHPRLQVVFGAIRRNKHVITANKALVAAYLGEIQELLKEHPGVTFGYEAAVCGGE